MITRGMKGVEAVTIESINKHVCNGVGCFLEPYHIVVDQDTVPVKESHRRVPFRLQDRLNHDLVEKQVIQKVTKPADWVHNLVIVEKKDGSLRLPRP